MEHVDAIIVGAGISGIDMAYRLRERNPTLRYMILEARSSIGGTWDLFRYPGIRSDSDIATLGFPFRPYRGERAIVDGETIRAYVEETARAYGIDRQIRFGHRVRSADWSNTDRRWTIVAERDGEPVRFTCTFLLACAGYYNYSRGYTPEWPSLSTFEGTVVHPQFWPHGLEVRNKRIVVIGSGATAVTLVPALADAGAQVTMLQRSPSYVAALPSTDPLAHRIRRRFPARIADALVRWKNIGLSSFVFGLARKRPERFKQLLRDGARAALGPEYPQERYDAHFTPSYQPWDQRLCLVPDGDLFAALRSGAASIVTDQIAEFTREGIRLSSGEELRADIIVTATGLDLQFLGGADLRIDGAPVEIGKRLVYRGTMLEGVPNLAFSFGYTHSSWTLKVDLNARYVAKLLRYMRRHAFAAARPTLRGDVTREPLLGLTSGYVQRSAHMLPQKGPMPWRTRDTYILDFFSYLTTRINDGTLRFTRP